MPEVNDMRKNLYCKISNDRAPKFNIVTKIIEEDGVKKSVKCAKNSEAVSHIKQMTDSYIVLQKKYNTSNINFAEAREIDNQLYIDWVEGDSFDVLLSDLFKQKKKDEAISLINKYFDNLFINVISFTRTEEYIQVFGNTPDLDGKPAVKDIDIDCLFGNAIYKNQEWYFYDYEWFFDFLIPVDYIKYRVIMYFFQTLKCDIGYDLYNIFGLSKDDIIIYSNMESKFQQYVYGTHKPLWQIYGDIHGEIYNPRALIGMTPQNRRITQVFFDYGEGCSEENSICIKYDTDKKFSLKKEISIDSEVKKLRLDPAYAAGILKVHYISDGRGSNLEYTHNGNDMNDYIVFLSDDPKLFIDLEGKNIEYVKVSYEFYTILYENDIVKRKMEDTDKELKNADKLSCTVDAQQKYIHTLEENIDVLQRHIAKLHRCIKNPIYGGALLSKKIYSKTIGKRIQGHKKALSNMYHEKYKSLMDCKDDTLYEKWINEVESNYETGEQFDYRPKISVLVPVYNVMDKHLIPCIESVLTQTYDNWELCMADDASTFENVRDTLKRYEDGDKIKVVYRSENGHISRCSNSALDIATGEFIAYLDCDDVLAPNALYEVVKRLNKDKELDLIYSDEDKIDDDGKNRHMPHFKPDWSPDTLLSHMYTCHLSVYRTSIARNIGGLRVGYEGSQDYDFALRFTEKTQKVAHIPKILYHWRERLESTSGNEDAKPYVIEATRRAKEDALRRRGIAANVVPISGSWFRILYNVVGNPKVSILIPSKDNYDILERCVNSIYALSNYHNFEIVLVDNGSTEENRKRYQQLADDKGYTYVYKPMKFNFSKMCNLAASYATGDYYLFLNDDTEVREPEWISIMVGQASQAHVGAVGAKLLYPETGNIQHIGVLNLTVGPAHALSNFADDRTYYFARNKIEYDWCAVTAACLMVKKSKYEEVGGFDESLAVAYNDVDFCFKLLERGYYNVVRTDAVLIHHESVSRGNDLIDPEKIKRLQCEQQNMYQRHPQLDVYDPFYNINLTQDDVDFSNNTSLSYEHYNKINVPDKKYRQKEGFIGNIDIIRTTKLLYIEGWAYFTGYGKNNDNQIEVLLKNDKRYYLISTDKVYRPDVAKANDKEVNIEFTGFRLTVPKDEIEQGSYEIWIICKGCYIPQCGVVEI